jgi:hypothetical protein
MLEWMKENVIPIKKYNELTASEQVGKMSRGIFVEDIVPEYTELYQSLVDSMMKTKEKEA